MSFKVQVFQENVERCVLGTGRDELLRACEEYDGLSAGKKTRSIQSMMAVMDRAVDFYTRRETMEACGRRCIGASTLDKARRLQQGAQDLDELLLRLNESHIGGGQLRREGNTIHATYQRCYCGSVSKAKGGFSGTYCLCSCGWYRQLFETLLGRAVKVELLGSILQGHEACRFLISVAEQ